MDDCRYCSLIDSMTGGFVCYCEYANRVCMGDDCEYFGSGDSE